MASIPDLTVADIVKERKVIFNVAFNSVTKLRLWLFCRIVIFATWVGGFGDVEVVDVDIDDEPEFAAEFRGKPTVVGPICAGCEYCTDEWVS